MWYAELEASMCETVPLLDARDAGVELAIALEVARQSAQRTKAHVVTIDSEWIETQLARVKIMQASIRSAHAAARARSATIEAGR
jgi:hypothetical protein